MRWASVQCRLLDQRSRDWICRHLKTSSFQSGSGYSSGLSSLISLTIRTSMLLDLEATAWYQFLEPSTLLTTTTVPLVPAPSAQLALHATLQTIRDRSSLL